jgi:predicted O-methyltransferase YrrM
LSVISDPKLESLLADLHARSDAQIAAMSSYDAERAGSAQPPAEAEIKAFRRDKLVALDRDKAEFCYQLCRASRARRIVEAGTSWGVSTLYLAAALRFIDLREGDLRETLKDIGGPVDFMLVDIWIAMARPALEMVTPYLRPGAIVICDNTEQHRSAYADYFAFLDANGFRTMTLPFAGGLEMSVRC